MIGSLMWRVGCCLGIALPIGCNAQGIGAAYESFITWKLGEPSRELKGVTTKVTPKANYEEVTFLDSDGNKIDRPQELWGVVLYDTLYLNLDGKHFVRMKEQGAFCYFNGPQYVSPEERRSLGNNTLLYGLLGTGVTAMSVDARNRGRVHYLLNSRTGMVHLMDPGYMRLVLADLPNVDARYQAEADRSDPEVMLRYVREANQRLAIP
jgi:hypothetical protein